MYRIPSHCIITSKLSNIEINQVINLIYFNEKKIRNQNEIRNRLKTKDYIISIGISNQEELEQMKDREIPIIHIKKECRSLILQETKRTNREKLRNIAIFNVIQPVIWILYVYNKWNLIKKLKRGKEHIEFRLFNKGILPIPNYMVLLFTMSTTTLLSWVTKRWVQHTSKGQYHYLTSNEEFILLRNDLRCTRFQYYFYNFIVPFSASLFGLYYVSK